MMLEGDLRTSLCNKNTFNLALVRRVIANNEPSSPIQSLFLAKKFNFLLIPNLIYR